MKEKQKLCKLTDSVKDVIRCRVGRMELWKWPQDQTNRQKELQGILKLKKQEIQFKCRPAVKGTSRAT